MNSYEKDYRQSLANLDAALHKREDLSTEIDSLQERIHALETLLQVTGSPIVGDTQEGRSFVDDVPTLTTRVRGLLTVSRNPLTTAEILHHLEAFGWNLDSSTNRWALVHGICRRLRQQERSEEERRVGKECRSRWS